MCGICGLAAANLHPDEARQTISRMNSVLSHRGPDGAGVEVFAPPDLPQSVALGHRRLSIIDLSQAGHQPMSNEDGSIWVSFNGEIYNFQELRSRLLRQGHSFRSQTDTEVIVHLYEELGPDCARELNGIFAFAVLDRRARKLLLARDHLGVKPLYYSSAPGLFLFGSEIKSILASGLCKWKVDWQAVYDYLTFLYVPCPETVFDSIRQVPPAHFLVLDLADGSFRVDRYWQVRDLASVRQAPFEDLKAQAQELLADSVKRQLISDVPLGVFLSGGIDSTIVTGLAKRADPSVRTFTITFPDAAHQYYDERERAAAASRHLGTDHHEIPVPSADPIAMLGLISSFDQPFGNPTYYLMRLISRAAREHITVALCGAGGDELYAGYPRYRAMRLARRMGWVPRPLLALGGRALRLIGNSYKTMSLRRAQKFLGGLDHDSMCQFAKLVYFFDGSQKTALLDGHHDHPGSFSPSERFLRDAFDESVLVSVDNRLLHLDTRTFLVDNVLEYTDKMSMADALEVRVPLLDHRFVEFSLNVPFDFKFRRGQSKLLLREAFADFFPPALRNASKKGFNVPVAHYILGPLGEYFNASQQKDHPLRAQLGDEIGVTWREGVIKWDFVQHLWNEFRQGRRDNSYELFALIAFDVWWRKYVSSGDRAMESLSHCAIA